MIKIQETSQSTIARQNAEISRVKVMNKQLSAQTQQKESELITLRKENKKFKDYFQSTEQRMQALRIQAQRSNRSSTKDDQHQLLQQEFLEQGKRVEELESALRVAVDEMESLTT